MANTKVGKLGFLRWYRHFNGGVTAYFQNCVGACMGWEIDKFEWKLELRLSAYGVYVYFGGLVLLQIEYTHYWWELVLLGFWILP